MKLFLDNNESDAILAPLRAVFIRHEFRSAGEEGLADYDDLSLFLVLARRQFSVIITPDDRKQSGQGGQPAARAPIAPEAAVALDAAPADLDRRARAAARGGCPAASARPRAGTYGSSGDVSTVPTARIDD